MKPPRNEREARSAIEPWRFERLDLAKLASSGAIRRYRRPTTFNKLSALIKSMFKEIK